MAKILELRYYETDRSVELLVQGHFTEAAELARKICSILLGPNGRWRFFKIQGIAPPNYEFASHMIFDIKAENYA